MTLRATILAILAAAISFLGYVAYRTISGAVDMCQPEQTIASLALTMIPMLPIVVHRCVVFLHTIRGKHVRTLLGNNLHALFPILVMLLQQAGSFGIVYVQYQCTASQHAALLWMGLIWFSYVSTALGLWWCVLFIIQQRHLRRLLQRV